jgi:hypothetical protein
VGAEEGGEQPLEVPDRRWKSDSEKGGCMQSRAVDDGDVGHGNGGERSSEASVAWGSQTRDLVGARLNRVGYIFPYLRQLNFGRRR